MGWEWPAPGISVFHETFFVSLHSRGMPVSSEIPWPSGPRNWVQLGSAEAMEQRAVAEATRAVRRAVRKRVIVVTSAAIIDSAPSGVASRW